MKVILLQDVPAIGHKHDVKNVADGHALNYLIPRKFALPATAAALHQMETAKKAADQERSIQHSLLLKNLGELQGKEIEISEKANEEGHLYAGIHAKEISALIKEKTRLDIPEDSMQLDQPIKAVGEFPIKVSVGGESAAFVIKVVASR